MKEKTLAGLNIQQPWAELILSGKKTIETRFYKIPEKHLGKEIALIETPGPSGRFRARIVGTVIFSSAFRYESKSEFIADKKKHLVDENDTTLGWKRDRKKWGWKISRVTRLAKPIVAPSPRGIVFCSRCKVPAAP